MNTSFAPLRRGALLLLSLVIVGSVTVTGLAAGSEREWAGHSNGWKGNKETLAFDVAENATRFFAAASPVFEDGLPAAGNAFITQGYIYPAGTLDTSNGVLSDGSPEFPDQVIGTWFCRGYLINDGTHTTSGPLALTTQFYNFGAADGDVTLLTEGYELADVNVAIERAVTGGTGPYKSARGEASQTLLGFNSTHGLNLTIEVEVTKR